MVASPVQLSSLPVIEQYLRTESEEWLLRTYEGLGARVGLVTLLADLAIADIYEDVQIMDNPP